MQAGRMKYRISILEPKCITDRMGAEKTEYVLSRTVHAERVKMGGRNSDEVGEHFAAYDAEFNIRDVHPVSEGWRVQQIGGYLYNVDAIIPNLDRGFKTLRCSRINE